MLGFGVERALAAGMNQGMEWLLQMDPDELLYPQGGGFDITVGVSINITIPSMHDWEALKA